MKPFTMLLWVGLLCAPRVLAQPVFSIDFQGPTIGQVDSFAGQFLTEGDLLVVGPTGVAGVAPLSLPGIVVFGGTPNPGG
jgi:hypothetical protein